MNAPNANTFDGELPQQLTNSKHIVTGLLFAFSLSNSAAQRLLLLSAAHKIAELEAEKEEAAAGAERSNTVQTAQGPTLVTSEPLIGQTGRLSERAKRLIEHCVGMYDQDETDCGHFDGMKPPTDEEAHQFLHDIENSSSVTLAAGEDQQVGQAQAPDVQASVGYTRGSAKAAAKLFLSGLSPAQNATYPVQDGITVDALVGIEREKYGRTLTEDERMGPLGMSVAREFITRAATKNGMSVDTVNDAMQRINSKLGEHLESGNVPAEVISPLKDFNTWMKGVVGVNQN